MILVADSGSTKSDWVYADGDGNRLLHSTAGINPIFHSVSDIANILLADDWFSKIKPESIYFYGPNCHNEESNQIVIDGLRKRFPAAQIEVDHDMVGAALAVHKQGQSIVCILGTGSNSIHYDGNELTEVVPALGYVLGDEGSGAYFGKFIVRDYLYNRLPEGMAEAVFMQLNCNKNQLIQRIYQQPGANVFLASLMKLLKPYSQTPYAQELLKSGFKEFIKYHVLCYPDAAQVPIHFIGSVAFHYQDILKQSLDEMGLKCGKIERKPIDNLVKYHLNRSQTLTESI